MNRSVYIAIGNHADRLYVTATINEWQDGKIVQRAEVDDVVISPVPLESESAYRQWVTAVARTAARALEDSLMKRIYASTATEPLQWESTADVIVEEASEKP